MIKCTQSILGLSMGFPAMNCFNMRFFLKEIPVRIG